MTRDAIKELKKIFYESLIEDNDKWIRKTVQNSRGSWIEYRSPEYSNMKFEYCKLDGLCYVYLENMWKHYVFQPRLYNFKKHIKKIDKRYDYEKEKELLKEIDSYKWSKEK